jgi:hypothetical protein
MQRVDVERRIQSLEVVLFAEENVEFDVAP